MRRQELLEGLRPGFQLPPTYQGAADAVAAHEAKEVTAPEHLSHSQSFLDCVTAFDVRQPVSGPPLPLHPTEES